MDITVKSGLSIFSDKMIPLLLSMWLESGVEELNSENLNNLYLILSVYEQIFLLLESEVGILKKYAPDFTKFVFKHFPLESRISFDREEITKVSALNVVMSKMIIRLKKNFPVEGQDLENLLDYISSCLKGEKGDPTQWRARQKITQFPSFLEVLPLIEDLIVLIEESHREQILEVFTKYYKSCPSNSVGKKYSLQLIKSLLKRTNPTILPIETRDIWIFSLPKVLWELGVKNPSITEIILDILLITPHLSQKSIVQQLQNMLVPLFFSKLTKQGVEKQVFGCFVYLPSPLQKKLIHILYHSEEISDKMQLALVATATAPNIDVSIVKLIVEILLDSKHLGQVQRINVLLSLIVGICVDPFKESRQLEKTSAELDEDRFLNISELISNAFTSYRLHSELLTLIEKPFLQVLNSPQLNQQTKTTLLHFLTHYCKSNQIDLPATSPTLAERIYTLMNTPIIK